ncbi:hypothetical protein NQ318_019972 [Aromia moschata]|uniref:Uncharacterized protein n=1 Tax=Aromia moschata TaxID=1265417 RepID=A0AAV8Y895_9CUCU|nr:hypothetical protein NQ318_019972 [Aromia moschata]
MSQPIDLRPVGEMVYLTEIHKTTILQMIGYGDRTRTQGRSCSHISRKISGVAADISRYRVSRVTEITNPLRVHEPKSVNTCRMALKSDVPGVAFSAETG